MPAYASLRLLWCHSSWMPIEAACLACKSNAWLRKQKQWQARLQTFGTRAPQHGQEFCLVAWPERTPHEKEWSRFLLAFFARLIGGPHDLAVQATARSNETIHRAIRLHACRAGQFFTRHKRQCKEAVNPHPQLYTLTHPIPLSPNPTQKTAKAGNSQAPF